MTPGERLVLEDAEEEVRQISDAQGEQGATGVPKPPVIESTETVLEAGVFGFDFAGQPTAHSEGPGPPPPPPEDPTGACCIAGICSIRTEEFCSLSGGTYEGDDTVCDPNPCPQLGACCDGGDCNNTFEVECEGTWYEGESCSETLGACCDGVNCTVTTELCCEGEYKGNNTTCDPNPCEPPPCLCFVNPVDEQCYANKTVTAVVTGSNPGGCDCTLTANFESTFTCDLETGDIIPSCSGTWHKVVTLTPPLICSPLDSTDNWVLQSGTCSGPSPSTRCGWNSSCATPDDGECCGGFSDLDGCGISDLSIYAEDCSSDCCDAQPGCYNVDITVTYF